MKNCNLVKIVLWLIVINLSLKVTAQPFPGKIGVNLGTANYVDMVKQTNRVNYPGHCPDSCQTKLADSSFDAGMWPKCDFNIIWDARLIEEWGMHRIDDPEVYRVDYSGVYKGSFIGQADLIDGFPVLTDSQPSPWKLQNKIYDAGTNKTTFEIVMDPPGPDHGIIVLEFKNTKRTAVSPAGSGITNLKLIRPGYDTATTQVFVDEVYSALGTAGFSTMRAMGLTGTAHGMKTTYPDTLGWNSRKKLSEPWWGGAIGKRMDAAPWEVFIDLCNQTSIDMWINIPISATDDYVVQLAKLIQSRLNGTRNVYIEISNEVWGFSNPSGFLNAEATALGITPGQNYARRAYKAAIAFQTVFGAGSLNNKIRVLLQWQAVSASSLDPMCDYITKTYGAVNNYIYGIGGGHYFQTPLMKGSEAGTVEDIVVSSYNQADERIAIFDNITNIAKKYNLTAKGVISYEGGPAMCNPLSPNVLTTPACITAFRDSCMAASVRRMYKNFFNHGGILGCYFALGSPYSRYGCWGLTDDLRNPHRTSLMKCMQELLGELSSPTPPEYLSAVKKAGNTYLLKWKDMSSDETGFIIERKDTSGKYIIAKKVSSNDTLYIDTVTYYIPGYYRIKAYNASGTSTYANLAMVIDSTPLPAPKNFQAYDITKTSCKLKWDKIKSADLKNYKVYKDNVLYLGITDSTISVTGLTCGKTYKFNVVSASKSGINSEFSDTLKVTTLSCSTSIGNSTNIFSVSPNPASDIIRIQFVDEMKKANVCLINMLGEVIYTSTIMEAREMEINVSSYPNGIYMIKVQGELSEEIKLIIKQ